MFKLNLIHDFVISITQISIILDFVNLYDTNLHNS